MDRDWLIHRIEDVERMALEVGFLPFFQCGIDGFSIEEHTPQELWFNDEHDGPWEWKGPLIAMGSLAYGKFFNNKAGFVALEWLPDLMHYRRSMYHFPHSEAEKEVYDSLVSHNSMLSREIKKECGFTRPPARRVSAIEKIAIKDGNAHITRPEARNKGFDSIMTRLQMSTYVIIADFEYKYDHEGKRHGWGVARYTTPELMYGDELSKTRLTPEKSLERIVRHMKKRLPQATEQKILNIISI